MEQLRTEARSYYDNLLPEYKTLYVFRHPLEALLDEYDKENPGLNAWQLKAAQYRILAENVTIKLFVNAPFYFATNMLPGIRDGRAYTTAGGWLYKRNNHLFRDADTDAFDKFNAQIGLGIHLCCGPYVDNMHYCYPINTVITEGFESIYNKAAAQIPLCKNKDEKDFLECAMAGLEAVRRLCQRFAEAADALLPGLTNPVQRSFMEKVSHSARIAPWKKCSHFYEGLSTIWLCRDVCGPLDGLGNSHLGRVDNTLYELYRNDIDSGYMTKDEAYDLIKRFIVIGDSHYNKDTTVSGNADHELEMGFVLGGCDSEGDEVFNDLTIMFLQAHREVKAIYPKIHARYGSYSSKAYLDEINKDYLNGRSVMALSNDDSTLPGLVHAGKTLEDARGYISNGCWSTIVEGKEACSGGNYFHMLKIMELAIYGIEEKHIKAGITIDTLDGCKNFEEVYNRTSNNMIRLLRQRCTPIGKYGPISVKVNPVPLFSSFTEGCLEKRKDLREGGAKYNPNDFSPSGFANIIDGLLAIKKICFDGSEGKIIPLNDFLEAVRTNWEGNEDLLRRVRKCTHFGDQGEESTALAQRFHNDLYDNTRDLVNDRGGHFDMSYQVYREFEMMAKDIRATPDGRRNGDYFALGIGPSRYHDTDPLPALVQSVGALDITKCTNSAIDIVLPAGRISLGNMEDLERAFAVGGLKHIQINCVNAEELQDARIHPELHQDLVVRICGFSAKFVVLCPDFQDEFIRRYVYAEAS
ncbi:formate C-acetyltransferase [Spirochaetia bacterium]|nr:formate C-acetyltransferase [Spirochaetia bacterium]